MCNSLKQKTIALILSVCMIVSTVSPVFAEETSIIESDKIVMTVNEGAIANENSGEAKPLVDGGEEKPPVEGEEEKPPEEGEEEKPPVESEEEKPPVDVVVAEIVALAEDVLSQQITIDKGEEALRLPTTLEIVVVGEEKSFIEVEWETKQVFPLTEEAVGETFTYVASLAKGYSLAEGVSLPKIEILVHAIEEVEEEVREIISFKELPVEIKKQQIDLKDDVTMPNLPEMVVGTLLTIEKAEQLEGETQQTKTSSSNIETTSQVAVDWELLGGERFTTEEVGSFTYTAALKASSPYTVASDVAMPTITVDVSMVKNKMILSSTHNIDEGDISFQEADENGNKVKQYKVDNGEWVTYTDAFEVTMSSGVTTTNNVIDVMTGTHNITLNGVVIESANESILFKVGENAIVNLTLENETTLNSSSYIHNSDVGHAIAVEAGATLNIDGTGNLNMNTLVASIVCGNNATLALNGGTVNATSTRDDDAWGNKSNVIYADGIVNLDITGGNMNLLATGTDSSAINTNIDSMLNLNIKGGNLHAEGQSNGIFLGQGDQTTHGLTLNITSGTLTAIGLDAESNGIYVFDGSTLINMTGGKLLAYGKENGLRLGGYSPTTEYDIDITGGEVEIYGNVESMNGNGVPTFTGDSAYAVEIYKPFEGTETITSFHLGGDATMVALGNLGGILFNKNYESGSGGSTGSSPEDNSIISILIDGNANLTAHIAEHSSSNKIGLGFDNGSFNKSKIVISEDATVMLAKEVTDYGSQQDCVLGGGNHTNSIIEILGNANVSTEFIGTTGYEGGTGRTGGSILIDTTGTVRSVVGIGSGYGSVNMYEKAADGGDITIKNGTIRTGYIGGADGSDGGDGGNITIEGGDINIGNGERKGANIGGGSGYFQEEATVKGGNGGIINISGGTINVDVYGTMDTDWGRDAGSAAIGGGGVFIGGNIANSLTQIAGGSGEITITGGSIYVRKNVLESEVSIPSTTVGKALGSPDANGFVRITGGNVDIVGTLNNKSQPNPWPVVDTESTVAYPIRFSLDYFQDSPNGIDLSQGEILSITLKDLNGSIINYGINDMGVGIQRIWVSAPEGLTGVDTPETKAFSIEAIKVRLDNTVHTVKGEIFFEGYREEVNDYPSQNGLQGFAKLSYVGESIETLQISHDWGELYKDYNGADQKPSFTVENSDNESLTLGKDYTIKLEKLTSVYPTEEWTVVTEMLDKGDYRGVAVGKGTYANLNATTSTLHINPIQLTATYEGASITKEYDGDEKLKNAQGDVINTIDLTVDPVNILANETIENVTFNHVDYGSTAVGTDISISGSGPTYTYKKNGVVSETNNYYIEHSGVTGNITTKVIGASDINTSDIVVTKTYDGTTSKGTPTGTLKLINLVGEEVATIDYSDVSTYPTKDVGDAHEVTLTLGNLGGANKENYVLAGGATTVSINNATITLADYNYTIAQEDQEFTQGGDIDQIKVPVQATGVNGETVDGTVKLYTTEDFTTEADNAFVKKWGVGTEKIWLKFTASSTETNYNTTKVMKGKINITVVEGEEQVIEWSNGENISTAYGTEAMENVATVTTPATNGGAITYSSSDTDIVTVNATSGVVTVVSTGTANITATAAKVIGEYRETKSSYVLTVTKKAITVSANDATRVFAATDPSFDITIGNDLLVGSDKIEDLKVVLRTDATKLSEVGNHSIKGNSTSTNYDVTVTEGTLTITKAIATAVDDVENSFLYSAENEANINLEIYLPKDRGTTSFVAGTPAGDAIIKNQTVESTDKGISFTTVEGTENETTTIPVTVTMKNYEDLEINVVVTLVNKKPVTITGITVANKVYDGKMVSKTGVPVNEQGYDGEYEYFWNTEDKLPPKDVGNYALTVKIADDNGEFMGESLVPYAITSKAIKAKPKDISIYNGDALPELFELEYVGIVAGDSITASEEPIFELQKLDGTILEESNVNGIYTIKWLNVEDDRSVDSNYEISRTDATLTITTEVIEEEEEEDNSSGGNTTPPSKPSRPGISEDDKVEEVTPDFIEKVIEEPIQARSVLPEDMGGIVDDLAHVVIAQEDIILSIEVLEQIKASNEELSFIFDEYAITILPTEISEIEKLKDLSLQMAISEVNGEIRITPELKGAFGINLIVAVKVPEGMEKETLQLYYEDSTGIIVDYGTVEADALGFVRFPISHASSYLVTENVIENAISKSDYLAMIQPTNASPISAVISNILNILAPKTGKDVTVDSVDQEAVVENEVGDKKEVGEIADAEAKIEEAAEVNEVIGAIAVSENPINVSILIALFVVILAGGGTVFLIMKKKRS